MGDYYAVPPADAEALHPIDMEVQVAYFDPAWGMSYLVSGDTPPRFFGTGRPAPNLRARDVIRLTGDVRPNAGFEIGDLQVTRLATDRPLRPVVVEDDIQALLRLEILYARLEAFVDGQILHDPTHLYLQLVVGGSRIQGTLLLDPDAPVPDYTGHLVTVEGVLIPERATTSSFVAVLYIGATSAITTAGPVEEHPLFSELPLTPISDIARTTIEGDTGSSRRRDRIRVEGNILTIDMDREISIGDTNSRIRVTTAQTRHIARGQRIEVCGVPMLTTRGWRLDQTLIRPSRLATPAAEDPVASPPEASTRIDTPDPDKALPPEQLPVLKGIQDVWNVPPDRQSWLHRIDFTLHVGYCDAGWNVMWAESEGTMAYFSPARSDIDFQTGQVIRVHGLARPLPGAFRITPDLTVETIEAFRPFAAHEISGDLTDPAHEAHMIRVTGLVEAHEEQGPFHAALQMVVEGLRVIAHYRFYETDRLSNLAGQVITAEGILSTANRGDSGGFLADLWIGRLSTIQPMAELAHDPRFNIPPTRLEDLPRLPPDRPVRVIGTIRHVIPGRSVTIEDHTDRTIIRTAQKMPAAVNSRVEVWGYPMADGPQYTLARPLFRESKDAEPSHISAHSDVRLTYRSAEDILNLSEARATAGSDAKLTGVVTWSSPHVRYFFVRDASAGIQVMRPIPPAGQGEYGPPTPGTFILVTGVTAADGAIRMIQAHEIVTQTAQVLSDPAPTTLEQVWSGSQDAQRIKLAGYVRAVRELSTGDTPRWSVLEIVGADGRMFEARLPFDAAASQYAGAVVRLTGVCKVRTAEASPQVQSFTLLMNLLSDIEEVEPAQQDPFDRPVQPIEALRSFGGLRKGAGLARIRGTVIALVPGHGVVVQEGADRAGQGIHAFLSGETSPAVGDLVDIVGLVGYEQRRVALREGQVRIVERQSLIEPMRLENLHANARFDCQLVQVRAHLLDTILDADRLILRMSQGGLPFQATLPAASVDESLDEVLRSGAQLELTGVYRINPADHEHPDQFNLLLRGITDIVVIDRPSWFTAERTRMLAGGFAVIIAAAFGWVYFLRRRVQHQTNQIRRQLVKEARLEDWQRNIIEHASDFIFMLDLSGGFSLFNPAGEAMTGYARGEVPRLTIYDLIDENDAIGLRTAIEKAQPGGEIQPFQARFRRKDGTFIWVEVAMRFLAEDDRITGALCVARDITERKRVEEELKRARDAAEANTKAKSAFLANMSHEIRTPMNGVIGMSNLLLDTPLSHEQRDFALTIRNSAEALLTVLNDILHFSKIEAVKLQFETLDFDLTETVEDTLDLLAARAASKQLELAALVPPSLPHKLRGDPGRLRQILLNLVGNAIKFTERGDVSLTVSLERETPTGVVLRFEVRDSGIGIAPEEQERLFTPFSQADASTTRRYGGTGLGLAICRQIVDQMDGTIGVTSEPGRGSTFWFSVEFARGQETHLVPPPQVLAGLRVLAVDDNATNRVVLQHYLEPAGVRLGLAADASCAMEMLRTAAAAGDPYRLILLDYHMPELDGMGLARLIHQDTRLHGTRMALLTSVDRRFTAPELAGVGIQASMAKPIRHRELMHTIQRALSSGTHTESAPAASPETPQLPMTPLRVLVAEDNPVNQRLTRIQLKKLGYEADLACNGLEVLEAFERVCYDVIFMDCQMPELDGYDATRRLASHPRRSEVRIVAMTANAMQGDRDKCLEAGMDDYLSKPTRPDDLAAALRRAAAAIARVTIPTALSGREND